MAEIRTHMCFRGPTEQDWQAAEDDFMRLFQKYGHPDDWQPHQVKEAQAEMDRICNNIADCCDFEGMLD